MAKPGPRANPGEGEQDWGLDLPEVQFNAQLLRDMTKDTRADIFGNLPFETSKDIADPSPKDQSPEAKAIRRLKHTLAIAEADMATEAGLTAQKNDIAIKSGGREMSSTYKQLITKLNIVKGVKDSYEAHRGLANATLEKIRKPGQKDFKSLDSDIDQLATGILKITINNVEKDIKSLGERFRFQGNDLTMVNLIKSKLNNGEAQFLKLAQKEKPGSEAYERRKQSLKEAKRRAAAVIAHLVTVPAELKDQTFYSTLAARDIGQVELLALGMKVIENEETQAGEHLKKRTEKFESGKVEGERPEDAMKGNEMKKDADEALDALFGDE